MNKQTEMTLPKLWNDLSLRPYLGEIRRRHGIVETLALPSMKDLPPVRIETLFVSPLLAQSQVSADSDPDQWPKGQNLFEAFQDSPQLVVLGDPGGGKTTLSNWLAWRLSAGLTTPLPELLENRVPIPCILREMPSGIFSAESTVSDLTVGIAERILGDKADDAMKSSLRSRVEAGSYVLILDGVDEIPVEHRKIVAGWMQKANSQNSPVLATSRIIGYEDWPVERVHFELPQWWLKTQIDGTQPVKSPELVHLMLNNRIISDRDLEWGSVRPEGFVEPVPELILAALGSPYRWAQIRYLMPFDQNRVSAFSENWYRQRCGSEREALEKARDFLASLAKSVVTRQLARTPNLLSLMAIVHREAANLPDGKALLYDEIANAYINTIDKQRKISPGDALAPYDWKERKAWLAYVGFRMQQLRDGNNEAEERILASEEDVLSWLAEAMENSGVNRPDETAKLFLSWVARRSGLLLPRGDKLYAFVHLSFQEYFCACYLISRIVRPAFVMDKISPDDPVTKQKLSEWSANAVWRETFVYLFELLSAERDSDWVEILTEVLFDPDNGDLFSNKAALAGRLMNDRHIRLGVEWKDRLADQCSAQAWYDWFIHRNDYAGMSVFPALLEAGYAAIVAPLEVSIELGPLPVHRLENLEPLFDLKTMQFCIVFNESISDLSPLAGATSLQFLQLDNTQVSDLSPLSGLTSLRELYLENTQVSDLSPLAELINLQKLVLNNTLVTDLSPLVGLTSLRWLSLYNSKVSDLSPLAGLTALLFLQLDNTKVSDLLPLSGLTALRELYLENTQVSDLPPLAELINLQKLVLNNTLVTDLSPLAGLTNLYELTLNNSQVSDLSPLAGLTSLRELHLDKTEVSDLSPLAGLTALQRLQLNNTQISDLSPLEGLSTLRSLTLNNTQITGLSSLKRLTALQVLHFSNTLVNDLSPLAGLTALRWLHVHDNQVSDLSPLARLSALQRLDLNNTLVSNLEPLVGLSALRSLHLDNTRISSLSPLARLTALEWLVLSNTDVTDLSPIAVLRDLQGLYLENTRVSDLSPLQGLTNLQRLSLDNTQVADLSPLAGLADLSDLSIENTRVTDTSPLAHLKNLRIST